MAEHARYVATPGVTHAGIERSATSPAESLLLHDDSQPLCSPRCEQIHEINEGQRHRWLP